MFFFFNDTATTEIYTLSLHDALPISSAQNSRDTQDADKDDAIVVAVTRDGRIYLDRKSTRLNSSHLVISYAVFCLKKKTAHPDQSPGRDPPVDGGSGTTRSLGPYGQA